MICVEFLLFLYMKAVRMAPQSGYGLVFSHNLDQMPEVNI